MEVTDLVLDFAEIMRLYYTQRIEDSRKEREMQRAVRYDKGT